jgi:hypothetical protein
MKINLNLFTCAAFAVVSTRYATTPLPYSSWVAPGIQTAPSGGRFPLLHQAGSPPFPEGSATHLPSQSYLPTRHVIYG